MSVISNSPFKGKKNVRAGSGPNYYQWSPPPFQKNSQGFNPQQSCDGKCDYKVTYVNQRTIECPLSYVECDYVL